MKKIAFIFGILFVGILGLLQGLAKYKRKVNYMPYREQQDDLWLGN